MNIPNICINADPLFGTEMVCKDPVGSDIELHLRNFSVTLLKEFIGQPVNKDISWAMQNRLNQELMLLATAGILYKDFDGEWHMTRLTKINDMDMKDVYRQFI